MSSRREKRADFNFGCERSEVVDKYGRGFRQKNVPPMLGSEVMENTSGAR